MLLPRYPVYIPTKGRAHLGTTAKRLLNDSVPFHLVVEPQEEEAYRRAFPTASVLVLPFRDLGSSYYARNWIWEHALAAGHARHWVLDDNIGQFRRVYRRSRVWCRAGIALRFCEDVCDRYENVAIGGLNYCMFTPVSDGAPLPPFRTNVHVYSCNLILNDLPFRWRRKYNEDTDLCLQALSRGWCTLQMNAFLCQKLRTMTAGGGNASIYAEDGRLRMARSLERDWPAVVTVARRFGRAQHVVNWGVFTTPLKLKPEFVDVPLRLEDYPMEYVPGLTREHGRYGRVVVPPAGERGDGQEAES